MDFDLNDEQREIKDVARELLAARSPFAKVREAAEAAAYDARAVERAGRARLAGDRRRRGARGQGLGAVELAVLAEELGYACAATPSCPRPQPPRSSRPRAATSSGPRWLPGLASGELSAGIGDARAGVPTPPAPRWCVRDRRRRGPADRRRPRPASSSRSIPPGDLRRVAGRASPSAPARPIAIRAAIAAEVVGVCQRALDMTLDVRQGAQAVRRPGRLLPGRRHRCAEMLLAHRERALERLLRGLGRRRRPASCSRGGGAGGRRRGRRRPVRSPPARSRPTAGSASPGRPTCTGCSSARSSTRRCWAAPSAIARRWLGWLMPGSRQLT